MSASTFNKGRSWFIAASLTLAASGTAVADDSSMSRFGGDSYLYFSGGRTVLDHGARDRTPMPAADPAWRYSHRDGLDARELATLSSSSLSSLAASPEPASAVAAADPAWRRGHPGGATEGELQLLSASSLAMWPQRAPGYTTAGEQPSRMAQAPAISAVMARMAKFLGAGSRNTSF